MTYFKRISSVLKDINTETHIDDDAGQIHGTWGGCAIVPTIDLFVIKMHYNKDEAN